MNKLEEARKIINEVDAQMAELFVRRMQAAEMVYEHKKEFGLPILDQAREAAVIEKNAALIENDVLKGYYIDYIKHMMSLSRAYQHRLQGALRVACSSTEEPSSQQAAEKIFPGGTCVACIDFASAYESVVSGENDVAVLPLENSRTGETGPVIDLIFSGALFINGIYELKIQNHPSETAPAGTPKENITRYAVLSKEKANTPALSNTVLMFTVKNAAGSLAKAIGIIGQYGYNMTALKSRPLKNPSWEYYFYIEIDGTPESEQGRKMMAELSQACDQLKIAGTFAPHIEI